MELTKNIFEVERDDPFANFSRVQAMGICNTYQGFLVRMNDKLSRLASFANKQKFEVSDESFLDTCLDLANYSALLAGFHESQKNKDKIRHVECEFCTPN